jgi:uncharacterized protein involved in exopolysaccharide biosynthesis
MSIPILIRALGRISIPFLAFLVLFGGIGVPRARSDPPFYADKTNLLVYRDELGKDRKITDAAGWAKRRAHILANMQLVMGPTCARS